MRSCCSPRCRAACAASPTGWRPTGPWMASLMALLGQLIEAVRALQRRGMQGLWLSPGRSWSATRDACCCCPSTRPSSRCRAPGGAGPAPGTRAAPRACGGWHGGPVRPRRAVLLAAQWAVAGWRAPKAGRRAATCRWRVSTRSCRRAGMACWPGRWRPRRGPFRGVVGIPAGPGAPLQLARARPVEGPGHGTGAWPGRAAGGAAGHRPVAGPGRLSGAPGGWISLRGSAGCS